MLVLLLLLLLPFYVHAGVTSVAILNIQRYFLAILSLLQQPGVSFDFKLNMREKLQKIGKKQTYKHGNATTYANKQPQQQPPLYTE